MVLRLNLVFCKKKEDREKKRMQIIITLYCLTAVPKDSIILSGGSTPAKFLAGYRGVSTTISRMAWAGLLGHGPVQSKYFLI